jgi:large subunit ribosomal protein L2
MGKRLRSQRRGKGSKTYTAKVRGAKPSYPSVALTKEKPVIKGEVVDFIKEPGRQAILAEVMLENNETILMLAPEGMCLYDEVEIGERARVKIGNVLPLKSIPEGCPIFNIEKDLGSNGAYVRATGEFALLVAKEADKAIVRMPSGKMREFPLEARATIGCVSSGMRKEKPFVKAGNKYYYAKSKRLMYPRVRGVAMNAADHPFGGEQHHVGKSKSVSRHAPPGAKVGHIASRRTGRRKR